MADDGMDEGLSVDAAAAMLTEADVTPPKPRAKDGKFTKADAAKEAKADENTEDSAEDSEAAEPSTDAESDDADAEAGDAEAKDDATDPDEPEPKDAPKPVLVKVKVDGVEQELPLEEVAKGYSRTADYTRKTQALAEERKAFVERELAPVRAERQVYAERLDALHTAIQSLMPEAEPDWAQVRATATPDEFTEAFSSWQAQKSRIEKVRAEQTRVQALIKADADREWQAKMETEAEKLKTVLPDMADPVKGKELKDDLIAYAKSPAFGYTDDDLAQVNDHRLLLLLDKARRWDEAQLRKPKVEDKIDRALDTIKPSAAKSKPRVSDVERAKGQLAASGSVEDAAALLAHLKL